MSGRTRLLDKAVARYGLAVAAAVVAVLVRLPLADILGSRAAFITVYPAVMVVAMLAGFRAGVLATVLGALAVDVWVLSPYGRFELGSTADLVSMVVFVFMGVFMSSVAGLYHRARRKASQYEIELARRESEAQYRELVQNANSAIVRWKRDGSITLFNEYAQRFFGYSEKEVIGKSVMILAPDVDSSGADLTSLAEDILRSPGDYVNNINENIRRDGSRAWMSWTNKAVLDERGQVVEVLAVGSDITELKRVEKERETTVEFLRLVNLMTGTREMVRAAAEFYQQSSGCEAVGIRLRQGDDYPYCEARGFSNEFVEAENSLCTRNDAGEIVRDSAGYPVHECMCGNVICGRFDPALPFFTEHGSFWTNCTTELLASTSDGDRQARTRNRCNGEGYESVALIPLRAGEERIGLLQLNDRRKGMFTPELIAMWERLGDQLAIALAKFRAEEAQRESEERFRALVMASSDVVYRMSPDWSEMYHLRGRDFIADTETSDRTWLQKYIHPDDQSRVMAVIREAIRTKGIFELEHRVLRVDGSLGWTFSRAIPLKDENGEIVEWFGAASDVSERRLAEDALKESEEKFRLLVSGVEEYAIFFIDPDGRVSSWNEGAERIKGYAAEEIIGKPISIFYTPEDIRVGKPEASLALAREGQHEEEALRVRKDGSTFWADVHTTPLRDEAGTLRGYAKVLRDITGRKRAEEALRESEERFRTMADAIPQLAWMANPDGFIFWYNQRWYEYTGTTPAQMEGWGWQSVHDPEVLPKVLERWTASIATGEPFDMEFPLLGSDGKFRTFLTLVMPMKDSEGRVLRWFGTNTDVSEARELEAHKQEFYRRTILAATEGKLLISEKQEIEQVAGTAIATWQVSTPEMMTEATQETARLVREAGMEEKRIFELQGCVVEALTNVIKHARGGVMSLHRDGDSVIAVISDSGSGIASMALPDVALTKNYSTAGTLGMGYKLMIHFADKLYLATGPDGTAVAVQMGLHPSEAAPQYPERALSAWSA